jgi:hypothetical protein
MTARITGNESALRASTEMHALKRIGTFTRARACSQAQLRTSVPVLAMHGRARAPLTRRDAHALNNRRGG